MQYSHHFSMRHQKNEQVEGVHREKINKNTQNALNK